MYFIVPENFAKKCEILKKIQRCNLSERDTHVARSLQRLSKRDATHTHQRASLQESTREQVRKFFFVEILNLYYAAALIKVTAVYGTRISFILI